MINEEFLKFFPVIVAFLIIPLSVFIKVVFKRIGKTKTSKLHNFSVIFLTLGVVLMLGFIFVIIINFASRTDELSVKPADGFTIEKYQIVMDVNEANSINVKEDVTVNFFEEGHRGIYRFIPSWLKYTNKDGETKSRKANVSNLMVVGDKFTIDQVKGKQRIKIGDPNKTLAKGSYTYQISYTFDIGSDPYESFDEFIFHAFGDYWGTSIKNASVVINFPKSFDVEGNIKFFIDKYRKDDVTSYVDYHVDGNTLYASLPSNVNLNSALTIDVELPDGYFVNETDNYGYCSLILCISCIVFAVLSFFWWKKNGKDLDKVPETVEFYPPGNLDASEIGYLYKTDTGRKLTVALIVELASKGFLKIIESDDKKTHTIAKINYVDVNNVIKREIKIKKLKEYKKSFFANHYIDMAIMNKYFSGDVSEAVVTEDFDKFYENSKYLVRKGFIKIESDSIDQYSQKQLDDIKKEDLMAEKKIQSQLTSNEKIVYNKLFENSNEIVLSEDQSFYEVFYDVAENVRNEFDDKINDLKSYKFMLFISLGFLVCIILWILSYSVIEDLNPKLNVVYVVSFVSNILTFIFAILMKRKNLYGEQMKAQINGFKNYLELAEKSQLEMLVEENPNYFYDILPYAYVLDVSKKWIEKFEDIPVPERDIDNFDYFNVDSLDSLSDSIVDFSSSSSSSGCGGGCSSCGGGCSSCGGGGSW